MNKPNYTTDEKEFIKKWGYKSDSDYDSKRRVLDPTTGKRITCLELAKMNKDSFDRITAYKKLHNID